MLAHPRPRSDRSRLIRPTNPFTALAAFSAASADTPVMRLSPPAPLYLSIHHSTLQCTPWCKSLSCTGPPNAAHNDACCTWQACTPVAVRARVATCPACALHPVSKLPATNAPAARLTQRQAVTEQKSRKGGRSAIKCCESVCKESGRGVQHRRAQARGQTEERKRSSSSRRAVARNQSRIRRTQVCRLGFGHNTRTRRRGGRGGRAGRGGQQADGPAPHPEGPAGRPPAQQRIFLGTNRS